MVSGKCYWCFVAIKRGSITTIGLFVALWLVALFRTYAPDRDYVYSKHGAFLFFLLVVLMVCVWLIRRKAIVVRGGVYVLAWLAVLWTLFSVSTLLYLAQLPVPSIIGLFNNLAWQLSVFLFALAWISLNRRLDLQSASNKLAFFFGVFALLATFVALQLLFTKQAFWGPFSVSVDSLRWQQLYGWYASPNYLVDTLAMGVLAAFFVYASGRLSNVMSLSFVLLMVGVLVATGSRGGIVGAAAAIVWQFAVVATVVRGLRHRLLQVGRYVVVGLSIGTVGMLALFLYVSAMGKDVAWFMLHILRLQPESLNTGTGRLHIWQDGLQVFASGNIVQMLFGIGNNAYVEEYGVSLHSTYLQLLVDHGLLILVAFLGFLVWFFSMAIKLARCYRGQPDSLQAIAFLSAPAVYMIVRALVQGPAFLSGNISWVFTIVSSVILASLLYRRN